MLAGTAIAVLVAGELFARQIYRLDPPVWIGRGETPLSDEEYSGRGLEILGIPCNQFGGQEPGSESEIKEFCSTNYGVSFPMMAKVHAKGGDIAPVYRTLTQQTSGEIRGDVRWNFTKFLVDTDGNVVARFESSVKPMSKELTEAVESVLPG